MNFIISKKISNDRLYAYAKNRFWAWDAERLVWKESHLLSKKYESNHEADKLLSPEDFLSDCTNFQPLEDYQVDFLMKQALKNAEPCKNAPLEPVKDIPPESSAEDKPLNFVPEGMTPGFDYSNFDAQTVEDLHLAENQYQSGKKMAARGYVMMGAAVSIAHDALCRVVANCDNSKHGNRGEDSFRQWCLSIGVTKDTAYRLLQISDMFDSSSPNQQKILKELSPSLLYAAAKPSAPEELVKQVKNGDITTHKQYQELLAQLKAKDEELAAAKKRAKDAEAHEVEATDSRDEAWAQTDAAEQKRKQLQSDYNDVLKENRQLRTDRVNAMNEADRAKVRLEKAHDAMQAAESARDAALADVKGLSEQNLKLKAENADLKKGVTVAAVVDEEEVDRRAAEKAWGLADARNAELQARNDDLEKQLAEALAAKQEAEYDPTEDTETSETCISNVEGAWSMVRPAFTRLVGTGEDFNRIAHAMIALCDRIHAECVKMIIKNDKETLHE